jgi:hypothetical protein
MIVYWDICCGESVLIRLADSPTRERPGTALQPRADRVVDALGIRRKRRRTPPASPRQGSSRLSYGGRLYAGGLPASRALPACTSCG